jgi:hypothetical protein
MMQDLNRRDDLPAAVSAYLAAEKAKDAELIAACFTATASVRDEGRDYVGVPAIRAWWLEAQTKYRYIVEPLDASVSENVVEVQARLTGDFPGSPADVAFRFTLDADRIASLAIE